MFSTEPMITNTLKFVYSNIKMAGIRRWVVNFIFCYVLTEFKQIFETNLRQIILFFNTKRAEFLCFVLIYGFFSNLVI